MPLNMKTTYAPPSRTADREGTENAKTDGVVDAQPAPAATMTTTHGGESGQGAMRLRGGCIPCPVSRRDC